MTQFKSLKWCYIYDFNCNEYDMYELECGLRITRIFPTGNKNLFCVYFSNGKHDILKADTKIQVDKIKK